jgi:hypothetical protein
MKLVTAIIKPFKLDCEATAAPTADPVACGRGGDNAKRSARAAAMPPAPAAKP